MFQILLRGPLAADATKPAAPWSKERPVLFPFPPEHFRFELLYSSGWCVKSPMSMVWQGTQFCSLPKARGDPA